MTSRGGYEQAIADLRRPRDRLITVEPGGPQPAVESKSGGPVAILPSQAAEEPGQSPGSSAVSSMAPPESGLRSRTSVGRSLGSAERHRELGRCELRGVSRHGPGHSV